MILDILLPNMWTKLQSQFLLFVFDASAGYKALEQKLIYIMLIKGDEVTDILKKYNICIQGVLHIGAHELQERPFYNYTLNVPDNDIVWIDANPELVNKAITQGHKNVYCGAISAEEKELDFKISNFNQSSSLLDFGLHRQYYPGIHYVNTIKVKTETLGSFFRRNSLDSKKYNFWNLDIQGVEYDVLRSSTEFFAHVDVIYTEVNTAEVYKGCGLLNQIDDLLTSYGFTRIRTEMTAEQWGDALYIKHT